LRNETTNVDEDTHTYTHIHTCTLLTSQGKHPKDFGSLTM
jgi:hypothetical protein